MNHIVIFCDKTIKEKHDKIDQTDCILKTKLEKAQYKEIRKTIASNETEKKKNLHQRKFKKYNNNLKNKPKPTVITS